MVKSAEKLAIKQAYQLRVRAALDQAYIAAEAAYILFRSNSPLSPQGLIEDTMGSAVVTIYAPSVRFRNALKSLNEIEKGHAGAWSIGKFDRCVRDQSLNATRAACMAARDVLEDQFPEEPRMFVSGFPD